MEIKRDNNTVEFEIEITADELEEAMEAAYQKERGQFSLPGFRKGRVPRALLEANFGSGLFFEDAVNALLPEKYSNAVEEANLKLASEPSIDLKGDYVKGEPVVLEVTVDVMPEFEVEGYEGLEIDKVVFEVEDDMIDSQLEAQRAQHGRMSIIEDRPVEEKDQVVIDFVGYVDGEEFEGGSAEDFELEIGSGQFIPGFEEELIGANLGDEVTVEVDFPEDYHAEDLAGKPAKFDVTINEIREITLPELDDDFIMDISEFDSLEEYKDDLRSKMEQQFENQANSYVREELLSRLSDLVDVDVPEMLIENEIDAEINGFAQQLASQGMDPNQYMEMFSGPELRDNFRESAKRNVKTTLILEQIAKQEEIDLNDEELEERVVEMADLYFPEDATEGKEAFIKDTIENAPASFKAKLIEDKTIDFLLESAVINEITPEEAEKKAKENQEETENTEE